MNFDDRLRELINEAEVRMNFARKYNSMLKAKSNRADVKTVEKYNC